MRSTGFVHDIRPAILAILFTTAAGAAQAQTARAADGNAFVDLTDGRTQPAAAAVLPQDGFVDLTGGKPLVGTTENQASDRMTIGNLTIVGTYDSTLPLHVDLTTTPDDHIIIEAPKPKPAILGPVPDPDDPFEQTNRRAFQSHVALQRNVIVPVEEAYTDTIPEPVRTSLHHFFVNLEFPAIFINDTFQLHPGRAGTTFARFLINSTVGIGGLLDPATSFGLPFRDNDFGATLANYGVGDYPYLMVPVIGPTNARDLSGKVVDIFLNPIHYVAVPGGILTDAAENGVRELDRRSENYNDLDRIENTERDPYTAVRRISRDRRNAEIGVKPNTE